MKKIVLAIIITLFLYGISAAKLGLDLGLSTGSGEVTVTGGATIFIFEDTGGIAFMDTGGIAFKDY